ncbi:MAG: hypothetical protein AB7V00_03195 [Bacilli bacterium]
MEKNICLKCLYNESDFLVCPKCGSENVIKIVKKGVFFNNRFYKTKTWMAMLNVYSDYPSKQILAMTDAINKEYLHSVILNNIKRSRIERYLLLFVCLFISGLLFLLGGFLVNEKTTPIDGNTNNVVITLAFFGTLLLMFSFVFAYWVITKKVVMMVFKKQKVKYVSLNNEQKTKLYRKINNEETST